MSPYQGQINFFGVLFHILFNPVEHYIILPFFSIFLIGTVVGDIFFEYNLLNNQKERSNVFKNKFLIFVLPFGAVVLLIGILYNFPNFFIFGTYSSLIYGFGVIMFLFSILITIEEYEVFKTKRSYRYLFYFSYYSFTIYFAHNLLYFLFIRQLNVLIIWIPVLLLVPLLGLLLRTIYKYLGVKASLKVGITVLSYLMAKKIEKKRSS